MRILGVAVVAVVAAMVVGCGGGAAPPAPGAGGAGGTAGSGGSAAGGSGGAPGSGGSGGAVAMAPDASPPVADSAPIVDTMAPPMPDAAPALPPDAAAVPPDAAPAPDTAPPPDTSPQAGACTPSSPIGCGANQWCSKLTATCLTAMTPMRWQFSHMCPAAGDAEVRLFDDTNGGQWPAGTQVFILPVGTQQGVDINCIAGARVCFGARGRSNPLYWGADSDDSKPCSNCCAICGGGAVAVQNLTCI